VISALSRIARTVTGRGARSTKPAAGHERVPAAIPLRRLDWRFLLPSPLREGAQEIVLLGSPPGLGRRLLELEAARTVLHRLPRQATADAVVVFAGARAEPSAIRAALRPRGSLYWEIDRLGASPLGSSPARVARRLAAAGLTVTGMYAALPDLVKTRAYVPMEAPGALAWFVRVLFPPSNPVRWAIEKVVLLAGGRFRVRLARLAPTFVVTATRNGPDRPPAVLAESALRAPPGNGPLRPLILVDDWSRLVMLPFTQDGMEPLAVLKVPRLPDFNDRTVNESEVLSRLRSLLDPRLQEDVPEPLHRFRYDSTEIAIERYLGGESLDRSTGRWSASIRSKIEDLHHAAEWLARFHRQVLIERAPWDTIQLRSWVDEPLQEYARVFGLTPEEEQLADFARDYAGGISAAELPLTWVHRDFNVRNILRSGGRTRVIDWEGCRPGPALCDLLHFCTPWFEIVHRLRDPEARIRGFEGLYFLPPGRDTARLAVRQAVHRYLHTLELDLRLVPLLMLYTWLELSLRRADQQRLQSGPGEDPRLGNPYIPYVGVLARHGASLFGSATPTFTSGFLRRA
jgi:hypothetical protein